MKKVFLVLVSVFLVLISQGVLADEAFVIEEYSVEIDVNENNSYDISETIRADFLEARHGIVRTLPLKFDDLYIRISDIKVLEHDYEVMKDKNSASIRIGSAEEFVKGEVVYRISYKYDVGADRLPDMDEFNHNIIGNEWDTTIKSVEFRITLPKEFEPGNVNCTSGVYGSTDNTGVEWQSDGRVITGRTNKPLGNFEGLTVALPLPEGYWTGAELHRRPVTIFTVFGYPLYILAVIISFVLWFTKGRDRKLYPSVEFEPPEGMTPSEIGYIIDGEVDNKDITSLIVYWAQKGYLEIERMGEEGGKDEELVLIRTGQPGSDARSYERHIFKKLFESSADDRVNVSDLHNSFYKTVNWGIHNVTQSFMKDPQKRIFEKGTGWAAFFALLAAGLPLFIVLLEAFVGVKGKGPLPVLAVFISLFAVFSFYAAGRMISMGASGRKIRLIVPILFGLISAGIGVIVAVVFMDIPFFQYLAATAACFISSFFASVMSKRTPYGDKMLEKVLGFREFLKTAEKDRLEMLFQANPTYYFDILPYAMVLGISDKWSEHFEGIAVPPPSWYRGGRYDRFSTRNFERDLDRSFRSINSEMVSAPSSSSSGSSGSSSSGGFSGGGSGGGGGHSW